MSKRIAYLLTTNEQSDRCIFSKNILEKIGFTVHIFNALPHESPLISNKTSMQTIYYIISNSHYDGFHYVFEDDINVLEEITLDEIIEYEKISKIYFYLGICEENDLLGFETDIKIYGHDVYYKKGLCYGLHAIGISKDGARDLLEFSKREQYDSLDMMDVILYQYCAIHSAYVVRYDLKSYIKGHKGIIFQDRNKFPPTII